MQFGRKFRLPYSVGVQITAKSSGPKFFLPISQLRGSTTDAATANFAKFGSNFQMSSLVGKVRTDFCKFSKKFQAVERSRPRRTAGCEMRFFRATRISKSEKAQIWLWGRLEKRRSRFASSYLLRTKRNFCLFSL